MSRKSQTAELYHKNDPKCPTGPRAMMGEIHRVGCKLDRNCPSRTPGNPNPRAVFFARIPIPHASRHQPAYFCEKCGRAFGKTRGIPVTVHE